jgi:hypothetical protein
MDKITFDDNTDVVSFVKKHTDPNENRPAVLTEVDTLYSQLLDLVAKEQRAVVDDFLKLVNASPQRVSIINLVRNLDSARYYYVDYAERTFALDKEKEPSFDEAVTKRFSPSTILARSAPLVPLLDLQKISATAQAIIGPLIYIPKPEVLDYPSLLVKLGLKVQGVGMKRFTEILHAFKEARGHDDNNTDALLFSPLAGYSTAVGKKLIYSPPLATVKGTFSVCGSGHDAKFIGCAGPDMIYDAAKSDFIITTADKFSVDLKSNWIVLFNIFATNTYPNIDVNVKCYVINATEYHNGEWFISNFPIPGWKEHENVLAAKAYLSMYATRYAVYISYLKTLIKVKGVNKESVYKKFDSQAEPYEIGGYWNVTNVGSGARKEYFAHRIKVRSQVAVEYTYSSIPVGDSDMQDASPY